MAERNRFTTQKRAVNRHELSNNPKNYSEFAYDQLSPEIIDYIVDNALRQNEEQLEKVLCSEVLTWDAIMAPLDDIADRMNILTGRVFYMAELHPDKSVREAAAKAYKTYHHKSSEIWFNEELYEKVKSYTETDEAYELDDEKALCINTSMQTFKENCLDSTPDVRERLREIDAMLTENEAHFENNIYDDKTIVPLTEEELAGLPQRFIDKLERDDEGRYIIAMKYPHIDSVMMHAENRETRRKVSDAFHSVGIEKNLSILEDTLRLRHEFATTLGHQSWAHYMTSSMLVEKPENIQKFYDEVCDPLMERVLPEIREMTEMLAEDGYAGPLKEYDRDYYISKLQKKRYGVDYQKIEEYFPLDRVLEGLFRLDSEAFDVEITKLDTDEEPVWHESVMAYAVADKKTGEHIATFYLDLFPREGKYTHAATFPFQSGRRLPDGSYQEPRAAIVMDISQLVSFEQLITLRHEIGHLWQHLLTKAEQVDFSGFKVEHDISEMTSQFAENHLKEWTILYDIAQHYETNESLPIRDLKNLIEARKLYDVFEFLRRLHLGKIDLQLHSEPNIKSKDIARANFENTTIAGFFQEKNYPLPAKFNHIMTSYGGGYIAYPYSKSIADDIYHSKFRRNGVLNKKTSKQYREIFLERGGTVDSRKNIREMLGRKHNNKALLKALGAKAIR